MKFGKIKNCHIVTCLVVIWLAACAPVKASDEVIVGLWEEDKSTCDERNASVCASIEFFSDGRFSAQNVPGEYFVSSLTPTQLDLDGTWELGEPNNDPFDIQPIKLHFEPVENVSSLNRKTLYLTYNGKGLFAGVDVDIYFEKVDKEEDD